MNEQCKPVDILLVEDNPGDVELVREALSEGSVCSTLHVARDGVEAMRFLKSRDDRPCPDIILLDLNLPGKSGREVLEEIKADPELMSIPVVVLTSSKSEEDISRSYHLHANCYVTKPVNFDSFMRVVRSIEGFWFTVVKLPCRRGEKGAP